MTTSKVLARLLRWQPIVFAALPLKRARCILATRVSIDVLSEFGIAAEPWPVACAVATPAYLRYIEACNAGHDTVPEADAWSVQAGIGEPEPQDDPTNGWHGHLVTHVPSRGLVLDLDLQSFSRPARGLTVPPAVAMRWPGLDVREVSYANDRITVFYRREPENDSYQHAPNWRQDDPFVASVVAGLARAVRRDTLPEACIREAWLR